MTLLDTLHITYDVVTPEHVEMSMPISEEIYQPHGFLHGGVGKTGTECLKSDGVLCEGKKSSVTAIPICKTKKFE